MFRQLFVAIIVLLLLAPSVSLCAPEAGEKPKDAPASQEASPEVKAEVVSVAGRAQKLVPGDEGKWVALKVGEELDELTVIRTGLRSKVVLRFSDRTEVQINRATKIGIAESRRRGALVTTHLGLKYGTLRASVDSSKGPNDARVSTPVATLSVRGSGADIGFTGDRGLGLRGRSGVWRVAVGPRTRNITAGESTNSQLDAPVDLMQWQHNVQLGDAFGGLTDAEKDRLGNYNNTPGAFAGTGQGSGPKGGVDPHHIILR